MDDERLTDRERETHASADEVEEAYAAGVAEGYAKAADDVGGLGVGGEGPYEPEGAAGAPGGMPIRGSEPYEPEGIGGGGPYRPPEG